MSAWRSAGRGDLLARVLEVGLVALLLGLPWFSWLGTTRPLPALSLFLAALLFLLLVRAIRERGAPLPVPAPLIPVGAFLALVLLSMVPAPAPLRRAVPEPSATEVPVGAGRGLAAVPELRAPGRPLSLAPERTRAELLRYAGLAAAFLLWATLLGDAGRRRRFGWAAIAGGAVVALFGMIERATADGRLFWSVPLPDHAQPFGPYVNRNHFAGLLAPLLPFAVAALLDRWRLLRREMSARALLGAVARGAELGLPLLTVAGFLLGTATVLSASRGGILAAAVGLMALGALWGGSPGRRRRRGGVLLSVPLFLGTAWLGAPRTGERFLWEGTGDRWQVWTEALPMFRDHPMVGIGAGAFADVFPLYRESAGPHPVRFAHAENEALELLVETGVVGTALLGAAAFLLLARAFRARRAGPVPWAATGALAALAAALAHALVDFNLHVPGNALLYAGLAALLWAATPSSPRSAAGLASSSTVDGDPPGH